MLLLSGFFGYQVRSPQERIKSPRVSPLAFDFFKTHFTLSDIGVVYVGDFQLPPRRRLLAADDVENVLVVQVKTSDDEVAFRFFRLLLDFHNAVPFYLRHAEALRVGDFLEENDGSVGIFRESFGARDELVGTFKNIVP